MDAEQGIVNSTNGTFRFERDQTPEGYDLYVKMRWSVQGKRCYDTGHPGQNTEENIVPHRPPATRLRASHTRNFG